MRLPNSEDLAREPWRTEGRPLKRIPIKPYQARPEPTHFSREGAARPTPDLGRAAIRCDLWLAAVPGGNRVCFVFCLLLAFWGLGEMGWSWRFFGLRKMSLLVAAFVTNTFEQRPVWAIDGSWPMEAPAHDYPGSPCKDLFEGPTYHGSCQPTMVWGGRF